MVDLASRTLGPGDLPNNQRRAGILNGMQEAGQPSGGAQNVTAQTPENLSKPIDTGQATPPGGFTQPVNAPAGYQPPRNTSYMDSLPADPAARQAEIGRRNAIASGREPANISQDPSQGNQGGTPSAAGQPSAASGQQMQMIAQQRGVQRLAKLAGSSTTAPSLTPQGQKYVQDLATQYKSLSAGDQQFTAGVRDTAKEDQIASQAQGIADTLHKLGYTPDGQKMFNEPADQGGTGDTSGGDSGASGGTQGGSNQPPPPKPSAKTLGANAYLQNLANMSPEGKALAPLMQNILDQITQSETDAASLTQAELTGGTVDVNGQKVTLPGSKATFDSIDTQIADAKKGWDTMQTSSQTLLDKMKSDNKALLDTQQAAQEKAVKLKAQLDADTRTRQIGVEKKDAVEGEIARLALEGAFGSSAGQKEVTDTEKKFDSVLNEFLATNSANENIALADISAKFTGLQVAANEKYTSDSLQNLKDTQAALDKLNGQSFTNTAARAKAETDIVDKFQTQLTTDRKEKATALEGFAKDLQTINADATKAKALKDYQDRELDIKQQAVTAAGNVRATSRSIAAQTHKDAQTIAMLGKAQAASKDAQARLKDPRSEASVYKDTARFNDQFVSGYDLANSPNATPGDRASGTAQAIIQFSHGQNPTSQRIQDLASAQAEGAQSFPEAFKAEILNWTQGGVPLSAGALDAMKTLSQQAADTQKQKAIQEAISVWSDVGMTNHVLSDDLKIKAESVFTDPDILNAVYQQSDKNAEDWLKSNPVGSTAEAGGGYDVPEEGTPSFDSSSPLSQYVNQNGLRVTQYYNGTYDQNHAKEISGGNTVFTDGRQTHESYNISPPTPGQTNVPAPAFKAGTVTQVQKSDTGYGNSVRIQDADGNTFIYGHLDAVNVKKGDTVDAGHPIGTMGKTGWATNVTMHLEARDKNNKPYDFALEDGGTNPIADTGNTLNDPLAYSNSLLQLAMQ